MRFTSFRCAILTVFVLTIFSAGCSHPKPKPDENTAAAIDETPGSSDLGTAQGLQTVHFAYDSSTLDSGAKSELKHNAEVLKAQGTLKIQIEGHCDERGGIQYNIALGERRAKAVKAYLRDLGIGGGRLTTVSYGKERPLVSGSTEEAYAKNRRANFVLTAQSAK